MMCERDTKACVERVLSLYRTAVNKAGQPVSDCVHTVKIKANPTSSFIFSVARTKFYFVSWLLIYFLVTTLEKQWMKNGIFGINNPLTAEFQLRT